MSALSSILYMGTSTGLRILSGLVTFVFLARILGPDSFGHFMLFFSVATILGLIANYGLTPYMLREIAIQQDQVSKLIGEVLTAKLILAVTMLMIVLPVCFLYESKFKLAFLLLFIAMLFDSLTEFLNTGYRATNRYASETKVATLASVLQLLVTLIIVYLHPTVLAAAFATMCSRIIVSLITLQDQNKYLSGIQLGSINSGISQLKFAFAYAVDFILQSLMGQVDSIVINQMIGISAVGVYQAGMRVFQGCAQSANVLANVFIPRLANKTNLKQMQVKEIQYVQLSFIGVGLLLGLIMAVGALPITHLLFGTKFHELAILFPWFGLLFFVRFFASSQGVILTSTGMQTYRTYANLGLWIVVFFCAYFLVPSLGVKGWLESLIIGNIFLGLVYMNKVSERYEPNILSMVLSSIGVLFFIPFVLGK